MKNAFAAFLVGLLFALGLGVSGMTQVEKVVGFLDVFGAWDPTLMFVMMGAIAVHFVAYRFIIKAPHPLFDTKWHLPERKDVNAPLVVGAAIFGIGWGLGGFCPGPALVSLAAVHSRPVIFVVSMIAGMLLFRAIGNKFKSAQ